MISNRVFHRAPTRLFCAVAALLILLSAGFSRAEAPKRVLTLMVYITGSDLESGYGAASADIQEMLTAGVDPGVTVLLMTGGTERWSTGFDASETAVSEISARGMRTIERYEALDMGDPDTLTRFLRLGVERAPAERYALILWDHGGGPLNGLCYDELNDRDCLTLSELRQALEGSPFGTENRLDWVGLDACLMASVEMASILAPFADYMIASEETEPAGGWDYGFLAGLAADRDGADTGRRVIDRYMDAYVDQDGYRLTLSCTRLSAVSAVEQAIDDLFGVLAGRVSAETFPALAHHRRDCLTFGRAVTGSDYDLADLGHLAAQYEGEEPRAAAALESAVGRAVIYQRSTLSDAHGLTVYSPCYNDVFFVDTAMESYDQLDFSAVYYAYMCDYADIWLGDALTDYSSVFMQADEVIDDVQTLTLLLTPDQVNNFAAAEVNIVCETFVGATYLPVYGISDVELLPDGTLSAEYRYQTLCFMDGAGQPLSGALQYEVIDGTYFIRAYLQADDEDMFGEPAWIMFRETDGALHYAGHIMLEDGQTFPQALQDAGGPAPRQDAVLDTEKWARLHILHFPLIPTYDESGALRPVGEWPYNFEATPGFYAEESVIDLRAPWSLGFSEQQFTGRNLYAQYVVTDVQGRMTASPLLPIRNNNIALSQALNEVLADGEGVSVGVVNADVVTARRNAGLYLRLDVDNRTDGLIYLDVEDIALNGVALEDCDQTLILDPGLAQSAALFIPMDQIPPLSRQRLSHISMDAAVTGLDGRVIGTWDAEIGLDLDLSALDVMDADALNALSTYESNGVTWELLTLTPEGDRVTALLRARNGADKDFAFQPDRIGAIVNGCLIYDAFKYQSVTIPAGQEAYVPVEFIWISSAPTDKLFGGERLFAPVNAKEYWGIAGIESLEIPLNGGTRLRFDLTAPVELAGAEAEIGPALIDADPVLACLRGLRLEDGILWIDIDLENHADVPVNVELNCAVLDGAACCYDKCCLLAETDSGFPKLYFSELPPSCRQRAVLKIPANAMPRTLALEFCYAETEEGAEEMYTTAAVLTLPESVTVEEMALESAVVEPALATDNVPVDPIDLFDRQIAVPENAEQYAVTLSGRLTAEQAATAARVEALLLLPQEDHLRLYAAMPMEILPDGRFSADYSGLLLCMEKYDEPLFQKVDGDTYTARRFALTGTHSSQVSQFVVFSAFRVEQDGAYARLTNVEAKSPVGDRERFLMLTYYRSNYVIPEAGEVWPYYGDWELVPGLSGASADALLDMPGFALKPVEGLGLSVAFAVTNEDGTGYTLPELIPYARFSKQGAE